MKVITFKVRFEKKLKLYLWFSTYIDNVMLNYVNINKC